MKRVLRPVGSTDAEAFAQAAFRSLELHAGLVNPPTHPAEAAKLIARRQGPADLGYVLTDISTGEMAGYIEVTGIVRGLFQSAYLGYYAFQGYLNRPGF